MHIPDGFLDARTSLITAALSATGLTFALRHTRNTLAPRKVPLLGLAAAFVFAAQMLNFPVAGGTSGHLVGGVLVAALLGPSAAVIVLATVLIVQCLTFADGGITALGANIFNMAIVGAAGGWMIYAGLNRLLGAASLRTRIFSAIVASWISTVLAAIVCAGELASSHTSLNIPWQVVFPAMTSIHMLIGIGEGLITALVLSAIAAARPELVLQNAIAPQAIENQKSDAAPAIENPSLKPVLVFGLLAALGMAFFLSPFASKLPDGLDHVAQSLGIAAHEKSHPSLLADYTPLAAVIATLLLFPAAWLIARLLLPKTRAADV